MISTLSFKNERETSSLLLLDFPSHSCMMGCRSGSGNSKEEHTPGREFPPIRRTFLLAPRTAPEPAFRTAQRRERSHCYRKLRVFGAHARVAPFPVLVPTGAARAAEPPLHRAREARDHCTAPRQEACRQFWMVPHVIKLTQVGRKENKRAGVLRRQYDLLLFPSW